MQAVQYLNFNHTNEVLDFYQTYLDANIITKIMGDDEMFKDSPDEYRMPEEIAKQFVMNSQFEILGQPFMASDTWEQRPVNNEGAIVAFVADTDQEAEALISFFNKASQAPGCQITMPLGKTEWAKQYGMFIDPFGVTWMINIY